MLKKYANLLLTRLFLHRVEQNVTNKTNYAIF
ncbi:hypothetical protein ECKD1_21591 [Escherichia coli KD1]|nr:hypothetical protein ECKD1_21591 [Escherichia coli KD1]